MNEERETLAALIAILHDNDLDALTVRRGDTTYELVAGNVQTGNAQTSDPESDVSARPVEDGFNPPSGAPAAALPNVKKVTAPIIGVFYSAPSPGAEPFVEVGTRIEVDQPLCILEAMKQMNEITSEYAGIVRRVLPENGALVSLGEEMFWIEP